LSTTPRSWPENPPEPFEFHMSASPFAPRHRTSDKASPLKSEGTGALIVVTPPLCLTRP